MVRKTRRAHDRPGLFCALTADFRRPRLLTLTGAKLADQRMADVLVDGIASAPDGGEGTLVFVEGKRNASLLEGLSRRPSCAPAISQSWFRLALPFLSRPSRNTPSR